MIGDRDLAEHLTRAADMGEVREWTESLWGKASPYVKPRTVFGAPTVLSKDKLIVERMHSRATKLEIHCRDGFHCRFCGIPARIPRKEEIPIVSRACDGYRKQIVAFSVSRASLFTPPHRYQP